MLAGEAESQGLYLVDFLPEGIAMTARRYLLCLALASAGAGIACGDFTSPTGPGQKTLKPASPVRAGFTRYILISGELTCVEGCDENSGPDQKVQSDSASTERPLDEADSTATEESQGTTE